MSTTDEQDNQAWQDRLFKEWFWKAPVGLALVGFGACVTAEGATTKAKSAKFGRWFFIGTIGLIILNSGLSIFGEAIKARTLYEIEARNQRG